MKVLYPQVPKVSSVVIFDYVRLDRDGLIGQVGTPSIETVRLVSQLLPLPKAPFYPLTQKL